MQVVLLLWCEVSDSCENVHTQPDIAAASATLPLQQSPTHCSFPHNINKTLNLTLDMDYWCLDAGCWTGCYRWGVSGVVVVVRIKNAALEAAVQVGPPAARLQ